MTNQSNSVMQSNSFKSEIETGNKFFTLFNITINYELFDGGNIKHDTD